MARIHPSMHPVFLHHLSSYPRTCTLRPQHFQSLILIPVIYAIPRSRLCTKYIPKDVASCASVQRDMLWCAATLLKKGGTLLYSTCTLTGEENEANVRWMLDKFENFRLTPAEPRVCVCVYIKNKIALSLKWVAMKCCSLSFI